MTDGRDALRRVRLRNDNAREIDKLFPMNVPATRAGSLPITSGGEAAQRDKHVKLRHFVQ